MTMQFNSSEFMCRVEQRTPHFDRRNQLGLEASAPTQAGLALMRRRRRDVPQNEGFFVRHDT